MDGTENRALDKARYVSLHGAGAKAGLGARQADSLPNIPAEELVSIDRGLLG